VVATRSTHKLRELRDYRFVDPEAQRGFDELMESLKQQILSSQFRNVTQGMKNLSPEEIARFKDMLSELNQMIEARERGEPYDFDGFMQRHGGFFPEDPRSLDELLEQMARRMAAMSRLMAGTMARPPGVSWTDTRPPIIPVRRPGRRTGRPAWGSGVG